MDNELRKVTHVENIRYDKAAEEVSRLLSLRGMYQTLREVRRPE